MRDLPDKTNIAVSQIKKQILLLALCCGICLSYDSFKIGWSGASLSEHKGDYGSKVISGILFGLEKGKLYEHLMLGAYLDGNVWPLNAMNDGGYYSISAGVSLGYKFTKITPYVRVGAEFMSLYHTASNNAQRNIGGVVAEVGFNVDIVENFGLGLATKSSIPEFYRTDGRYALVGLMLYFVYTHF